MLGMGEHDRLLVGLHSITLELRPTFTSSPLLSSDLQRRRAPIEIPVNKSGKVF